MPPRGTPRRLRRPLRWRYPAGPEVDFQRALYRVADAAVDAVQEHVLPVLASVRQDDVRDIPESEGWFEALRRAFVVALGRADVSDGAARDLVTLVSGRVDRFNREQFHRMLRRAYGVDVVSGEPGLAQLMRIWEAENIALIKSVPTQYLNRLHGQVVEAVRRGTSLRDMTALVRDSYEVPRRRAEMIARDQIGKLNADLTEHRQRSVGIEEYRWRGAMDEREREEHVAREGKVFRWDKPPPDGHPGQPIRCRCWAEAVLPEFEDLNIQWVHAGAPNDSFLNDAARRRMAGGG